MRVIETQERFCWEHGHHLGFPCPRCRRKTEKHVTRYHRRKQARKARTEQSSENTR